MDILLWLWWAVGAVAGVVWSLVWFLISGWVSTLLQITLLVAAVYLLKYGWRRGPAELWKRTHAFGAFFWSWIRAREPQVGQGLQVREVVRIVPAKEFGDINLSTLLSVLTLGGLLLLAQL
jgi:hypothetical protein